ncbi:hypothetical protein HUG17_3043 [Dermatophagoides farinae]|uniref:Uncharacterized protein n=1 Tax=Dermatophagoides farinae TaxID=6954 RepID=A0A9D4SFE5_DERFA|nr:hypothetical protein HUG17_3043 [Dermatophagoides farinae]
MGNSKSSMDNNLHKSFDDYLIDNGIKQSSNSIYMKSFDEYYHLYGSEQKISELKRGRSLFYTKSKSTVTNNNNNNNNHHQKQQQNFKRNNSLPPVSRLQRKQQSMNTNEMMMIEPKQLHKGFDMIRHHFGQKDCEWSPRLTELETSILLLNEKVTELELSRQDCVRKLSQLKIELEQQHQQQQQQQQQQKNPNSRKILPLPPNNNKSRHNYGHILRIKFIENYMKRLENLLRIDREPFLAITTCSSSSSSIDHHINNVDDRFCDEKYDDNGMRIPMPLPPPPPTQLSSSRLTTTTTTEMKCQQIKNYYEYLLKTVMPQLYGNQNSFKNKSDENYCQFRKTLMELRYRVQMITTQSEQQLLDAKRAFIQEIDSYLKTLNNMIVHCDHHHYD